MLGYRQHVTVQDPQKLILSNLPVKAGQQVEILIFVKEDAAAINPAEVYTDSEWDQLEYDVRSDLETEYILNNPILMKQIQDQSEWFNVSMDQLSIDVKD